jgi:hypothetical protein
MEIYIFYTGVLVLAASRRRPNDHLLTDGMSFKPGKSS